MLRYYTRERLQAIKESRNYQDLLLVALDIIADMENDYSPSPVAMVCGPISTGGKGSRKENLAIFARAIDRLSADGLPIFSQMPFEDDMGRIYRTDPEFQGLRLLEEFYLPILAIGSIKLMCFLPGWQNSVGATWEREQARKLNIPAIYLSNYYTKD